MSEQSLAPKNGSMQGEEAISKKGNPYRVDKEGPVDTEKGKHEPALMDKHDFSIVVNWPVTTDWVPTTTAVLDTAAITRYKLIREPSSKEARPDGSNDYTLSFTNTEHYDYFFTDKTEDHYEVNTYRNRDHYVRYTSTNPTIVRITGV